MDNTSLTYPQLEETLRGGTPDSSWYDPTDAHYNDVLRNNYRAAHPVNPAAIGPFTRALHWLFNGSSPNSPEWSSHAGAPNYPQVDASVFNYPETGRVPHPATPAASPAVTEKPPRMSASGPTALDRVLASSQPSASMPYTPSQPGSGGSGWDPVSNLDPTSFAMMTINRTNPLALQPAQEKANASASVQSLRESSPYQQAYSHYVDSGYTPLEADSRAVLDTGGNRGLLGDVLRDPTTANAQGISNDATARNAENFRRTGDVSWMNGENSKYAQIIGRDGKGYTVITSKDGHSHILPEGIPLAGIGPEAAAYDRNNLMGQRISAMQQAKATQDRFRTMSSVINSYANATRNGTPQERARATASLGAILSQMYSGELGAGQPSTVPSGLNYPLMLSGSGQR